MVSIVVLGLSQTPFSTVSAQSGLIVFINSDTVWTKANSPYNITGPLFVSEGATLTLEAGVVVNLNNNHVLVNGTLRALGSNSDKIQITSYGVTIEFSENSQGWDEQTTLGNVIENAILKNVNIKSSVSIKIENSNINRQVDVGESSIIQNSTIDSLAITGGAVVVKNNKIDLITNCYGTPEISNNVIGEIGPKGFGASPIISYNKIRTIGGYGAEGSSVSKKYLTLNSPKITNNVITEGIYLVTGSSTVIANNTITGFLYNYTYYVLFPVPGSRGEPRQGTFLTSGIDLVGKGAPLEDKIYITGNTISGCSTGIKGGNKDYPINGEGLHIENNVITNSSYCGIDVTSKAVIQNNSIINNPTAIILRKSPSATINYNNIESFIVNSILLDQTSIGVDATNNWWGTSDFQAINLTIHDFKYDFNLGQVTFTPILVESNTEIHPASSIIPEFPMWAVLPLLVLATLAATVCRTKLKTPRNNHI